MFENFKKFTFSCILNTGTQPLNDMDLVTRFVTVETQPTDLSFGSWTKGGLIPY